MGKFLTPIKMKKQNKKLILPITLLMLLFMTNTMNAQVKAFPEAEGYGKISVGGRGGKVIEVTNLNDAGTGSFRAACTSTGARIVVFRVAGIIELASDFKEAEYKIVIYDYDCILIDITLPKGS